MTLIRWKVIRQVPRQIGVISGVIIGAPFDGPAQQVHVDTTQCQSLCIITGQSLQQSYNLCSILHFVTFSLLHATMPFLLHSAVTVCDVLHSAVTFFLLHNAVTL